MANQPNNSKYKILCAWCGIVLQEGDPTATDQVSHACCLACKQKYFQTIDIGPPSACEGCTVPLNDDLTCPKCGVSHTASPCATCGRVGLHKDNCTEPPGFDTEGGPKYVAQEVVRG